MAVCCVPVHNGSLNFILGTFQLVIAIALICIVSFAHWPTLPMQKQVLLLLLLLLTCAVVARKHVSTLLGVDVATVGARRAAAGGHGDQADGTLRVLQSPSAVQPAHRGRRAPGGGRRR